MNSLASEVPQHLVPLSSAPIIQNQSAKSKKARNKTTNQQQAMPSRQPSSKSESSNSQLISIEEKFNEFEQFLSCHQPNRNVDQKNVPTRTQQRTVYSYSSNVKEYDTKFKKPYVNGQQHNEKPNVKSNPKKNSKMKMSASQPIIHQNNQEQASNNSFQPTIYEKYWEPKEVAKALEENKILQGKIRINQRSYEDAFITDSNGGSDIYINGLKDRNRSLNGDIVAINLKEKYLWKIHDQFKDDVIKNICDYEASNKINSDLTELLKNNCKLEENTGGQEKKVLIDLAPLSFSKKELLEKLKDEWFQKTGTVVAIIEKKNSRWAAGHLKLFPDKNKEWALFSPNDSRLPRIKIKINECPPDFITNSSFYSTTLFSAKILDIPINSRYAIGELMRCIGKEDDIEVVTEAFLIENAVDFSDFKEEVTNSLPQIPWSIPAREFEYRRDLRNLCIFTIDPASARDLDDALHCIKLNEDTYEIGVHIADVSYFVSENSPIDRCAMDRATSVYLVQKVIPMLPRLLCEELCSLNPLLERLTFSVIWKVKANGDIIDEWFGRTIINSAVKLSYEHAQKFIDDPSRDFDIKEFPEIRPQFNLNEIKASVLNLDSVARKLREKRFINGSLALNQTKISFVLNREMGMPYGYNVYQQKDSNRLVEEFMLLANIAVARRIYEKYPAKAILRRHPQPSPKHIEQVGESIKSYGYDCDIKSSGSIQTFLSEIQKSNPTAAISLTCLLTKTMQLAQYFCSGFNPTTDKNFYRHYGLAVPLYTHFTSPIRRYPDILVHRLLAASLGYCQETSRIPSHLNSISENCNDKKSSARLCSERSSDIFFSLFVNECGPLEEEATVTQILTHSFDVLLVNLGFVKRIYTDKLDIVADSVNFIKTGLKQEISFKWNSNPQHEKQVTQTIQLFETVNVVLSKHDSDRLKINLTLMHPNERINKNNSMSSEGRKSSYKQDLVNQRVDIDPYICD